MRRVQEARGEEHGMALPHELSMELLQDLSLLEADELENLIATTVDEVTMQVAIDSGSCANVVP